MKHFITLKIIIGLVALMVSSSAWACACGCGVFEHGTGLMLPNTSGGRVFAEYDFMDQNQNWSGRSSALAENNDDKEIRTTFLTLGAQYMFDRSFGAQIEVPYWFRNFTTTDDDTGAIPTFTHSGLGDVRIRGIYTGFSPDMATGISYGLKLPTGDWHYSNFDRDTEIGTGSTDILLSVYHVGSLSDSGLWRWYAQFGMDLPVLIQDDYRPGAEYNVAVGGYYSGWNLTETARLAPLLQVLGAYRQSDAGLNADALNSGYQRALLAPGVELNAGRMRYYADIEFPVYEQVSGNQLEAPYLVKLQASYYF